MGSEGAMVSTRMQGMMQGMSKACFEAHGSTRHGIAPTWKTSASSAGYAPPCGSAGHGIARR